MNRTAVLYALASAALFGASTPAAKLLIGSVQPAILAGLLYCGAGIGIAALRLIRAGAIPDASEVALGRADWPWLAGAIGERVVIGPLLLMTGLSRTEASAASLLLTLEGAATALIAWYIFHENFDRRISLGMFCLISGAAILSWSGTPTLDRILGPLAIAGACFACGLDNNLTRGILAGRPATDRPVQGALCRALQSGDRPLPGREVARLLDSHGRGNDWLPWIRREFGAIRHGTA